MPPRTRAKTTAAKRTSAKRTTRRAKPEPTHPYLAGNAPVCGDNLDILRELPDECVDLIYLDPPFNSNSNYVAAFGDKGRVDAQLRDIWRWTAESGCVQPYSARLTVPSICCWTWNLGDYLLRSRMLLQSPRARSARGNAYPVIGRSPDIAAPRYHHRHCDILIIT